MSQHDFDIANQTFPSFRSDLNDALQAAATISAGATAPTTPYAYQLWLDTSTNTYKARNAGNSAWISLFGTDLTNNGITFGDNDKAIFGAGSDLQIYHDGSNSYIDDTGTGDMLIRGSARILLRKAGTTENMIRAEADSYVKLYYDNAEKLATTATGVDVTGGLNTTGNVGIGTASPNYKLDVQAASLGTTSGDTADVLQLYSNVGNSSSLNFQKVRTSTGSNWNSAGTRIQQVIDTTPQGYIQFNGDGNDYGISFGRGSTERMRIESDGAIQYSSGVYHYSKKVRTLSIAGGATVTAFDLWNGNSGRGHYLVTASRNGASVAGRTVAIVGSSTSSASYLYDVLAASGLSLSTSGSNVRVTNTGGSAIFVNVTAIPLNIDGN